MTGGPAVDDSGATVEVPGRVRRVVSLVPSLTEAVAVTDPGLLVGATDWCAHPPGLDLARVRGTKNPDLDRVRALRPDLVVANFEENRQGDLDVLRLAGIPVWVTVIRTLPEALTSLDRMLSVCGLAAPAWLQAATDVWGDVIARQPRPWAHAIVPIWRRPWMVLGRDTFAGDLLARLGVANVHAGSGGRYPKVPIEELTSGASDLAVLPDEPYAFAADDGPEAFPGQRVALVSGRYLTWYGPSLVEARAVLERQLWP